MKHYINNQKGLTRTVKQSTTLLENMCFYLCQGCKNAVAHSHCTTKNLECTNVFL